jgi:hypothetical protein
MTAICAFLPPPSVITSRGIVPLPNRERAGSRRLGELSGRCRLDGDIKHGANRRSPPQSRQRLGKANALTLGRKSTLTNPRG